jgi:HPt (histidine-containing phosphotransfer) domain-containing protein
MTIVGLTAGSRAENLSDCLEAGMDAVTTKPVTIARLRAAIAEALARSVPPPQAMPPPAQSSRLRELADELGEDLVAEIVRTFAEDTQLNLASMRDAAARGDGDTLYRAAHSLAGAARNVGADALAARASALEHGVGSLGRDQMVAEIKAMQIDLDAALRDLGVDHRPLLVTAGERAPSTP